MSHGLTSLTDSHIRVRRKSEFCGWCSEFITANDGERLVQSCSGVFTYCTWLIDWQRNYLIDILTMKLASGVVDPMGISEVQIQWRLTSALTQELKLQFHVHIFVNFTAFTFLDEENKFVTFVFEMICLEQT